MFGAIVYGAAFTYFAHTTLFALVTQSPDYETLWAQRGAIYTVHGALMVAGGLMFGWAALHARWLPRPAVLLFLMGLMVNAALALLPTPDILQTLGSATRNAGLVLMGIAVLSGSPRARPHRLEGQTMATALTRTKAHPWTLKTPPGTAEYTMYMDEKDGSPIIVCVVGSTVLHYDARAVDDLHAMLTKASDWVELGGADEQKPAKPGTVEAWGRSPDNPVGGWYGLKKGLRGRFGVYLPPLLEELGLVELEHNPKNNRVRARKR